MINIFKRWFSLSKEQEIDDSQNPWAGLASYEDPETAERKLKFCGRDDDSYDLTRLIISNIFVTLYGKSGIGKTSLLNAGVFPELREEQYTPISVRLGIRDEEHPQSYQTIIVEAVEHVVVRTETINVIEEQQDQQSIDYLWNYFARHRFYDKFGELTVPVTVLDQYEEVFRGHRDEAETLLRQLDYLNDKDHVLDGCQVEGHPYRYEQNYRFVVSIREDDLYCLEDSIDNCYLPALKRCRYRLRSLSEKGATDIIIIPGNGLFNEQEKEEITAMIINVARNSENGLIDTNVLSIICHRLFVDFKKLPGSIIEKNFVKHFISANPFEKLFKESTRRLKNKEKRYIVEHLIDSSGNRNSISEADLSLNVRDYIPLVEGANRILQRVQITSDGSNSRLELLHDSFCEPIKEMRSKYYRNDDYRSCLRSCGCMTISSLLFMFSVGVFVAIIKDRHNEDSVILTNNEGDDLHNFVNRTSWYLDNDSPENINKYYALDLSHLSLHALSNRQYEDAELYLRNALKKDNNKLYYVRLLEILILQRKYDEVARIYNKDDDNLLGLLFCDISRLSELGIIDYKLCNKDSVSAIFDYSASPKDKHFYSAELSILSFNAIRLGSFKEAEQYANIGIKSDSTQLANYARLAESLVLQGRISEAFFICRRFKEELGGTITSDFENLLEKNIVPLNRQFGVRKILKFLKQPELMDNDSLEQ